MDLFVDAFEWLTDPEHWSGGGGIPVRTFEHLGMTAAAVGIACAIAIPIGLWLGHIGRGGTLAINISNVGRAIPTYAVLVVLVLTVLGRSIWATIIALVLFAIPPLLTNTYVGMREVDRSTVDAARGMGMSPVQVVRRVELPLAIPLIMNGVRLATVQVFATATIAAMVASGGLGRIITSGFARFDYPQIVAGAFLIAVIALVIEGGMEFLQRRLDPVRRAKRIGRRRHVTQHTEEVVGV